MLSAVGPGKEFFMDSILDPRSLFFENLDLKKCRIIKQASPVVLFCGGKYKIKQRPKDKEPVTKSLRHAILKEQPDIEFFYPEEIPSWLEDAIFENLVQLEIELAGICAIVVIIVESAGSIAELAAFSQLEELQEKIVVIKSSSHSQPSFIDHGILRFIESSKSTVENPIRSFPWDINTPRDIDETLVTDVIHSIKSTLDTIQNSQTLSVKKVSHSTTLIREFIHLFIALKRIEIEAYLKQISFEISKEQLTRKLFLLEKFKLIKTIKYDDATFYLSTNEEFNTLRLSALKGKIDATSLTLDCQKYYEDTKDRHRLGAIKAAKSGVGL